MEGDDSVRSSLSQQVAGGTLTLHFDIRCANHPDAGDMEICVRAKNKTDVEHTGEQVWIGSILVGEYMVDLILTNKIPNPSELTVLELGSGTGVLSILLSYYMKRIVSTDYSRELIMLEQVAVSCIYELGKLFEANRSSQQH